MLTFGKWQELMDEEVQCGGRTLRQKADYECTISMTRYLQEKAREIRLERGRASQLNADAEPGEIIFMRGLVGSLQWAPREGMPQGAGDASILASTFPKPKVSDLLEANADLRRLRHNDTPLRIRPIPLGKLKLFTFADSSLADQA